MPLALYTLTAGAFAIGTTEFVIMGLLLQVAGDLGVSIALAGLLISGYALGVTIGAPLITVLTRQWPRKTVLVALMIIFTIGNIACAVAPSYGALMGARIVTALAHGTFFGVGSVVATSLVPPERKASAIAIMFTGLTAATLLGVPLGAWIGLAFGWRATFWTVAAIGAAAALVLAAFVPAGTRNEETSSLRDEIAGLMRLQVGLGLAMTVLGYAGVFAVFTYVQPILTRITGFSEAAVSPILLVFGAGLAIGNLGGGWLADKRLMPTLIGTLGLLALVLALTTFAVQEKTLAVVFIGLLGAAAFATVAPLQLRVLEKAGGAGQGLASSLNIAAFNLGNALGAWIGGLVIDHGPGLGSLPLVAALVTLAGLVLALVSHRLDRRSSASVLSHQGI
ncbi:MFS transporter [Microvirga sp. 17 mud 1-3]|uniref:MFS transporter n=1 Tax=Microvirga sp. 17 mud 1-3 TaxID=2082949 RepID=UPI000D6BC7FC|nr:MFS transporter [Microvirga sp. 17 mud 1-3]AWM88827.1 MFS transporter [Microvirga sp. 17 mud 1-3]